MTMALGPSDQLPLLAKWFYHIYFLFENDMISRNQLIKSQLQHISENDNTDNMHFSKINFGEIQFLFKPDLKKKDFIMDTINMRIFGENGEEKILYTEEMDDGMRMLKDLRGLMLSKEIVSNSNDGINIDPLYEIEGTGFKCYSQQHILNKYQSFDLKLRLILMTVAISILLYFPLVFAFVSVCICFCTCFCCRSASTTTQKKRKRE